MYQLETGLLCMKVQFKNPIMPFINIERFK